MVVTVLLSGIPRGVTLEDLARGLDQCLKSDEVGSFVARDLPHRSKTGRRMVALDFKTGFDAMIAQDILNGYEYALPDQEYVLSAKVTNDPMYMPNNSTLEHLSTPPPPIYSDALVAYTSRREEIERTHDYLNDEIETLQKKLLIVSKKTQLIKAKKKLKKAKKARRRKSDPDSSDSEPRRKKKKKESRSSHSSPSPQPSTSTGEPRATGSKRAKSSDSSCCSSERKRRALPAARSPEACRPDRSTSRRRSPIPSTSRRSPLRSSPGYRLRRSPPGFRSERSPSHGFRSKRSPSAGHRFGRSPSLGHRSGRSPLPGHRSGRSPSLGLRSKRVPSPGHGFGRSPLPGHRSGRSPSLGLRSKRVPSPGHGFGRSPLPGHRSGRSPSLGLRSKRVPSPGHGFGRSPLPGHRSGRSPSPGHRFGRSPSPGLRSKRSPSPGHRSGWSPSPGYREPALCSPIYRRRSPSSYRSRRSERFPTSPPRSRYSPTSHMSYGECAEQPPASNRGILIVDRSTSARRRAPATVTEIHDDSDLWDDVDRLAEVLESEQVVENSDPEQLEDGEDEGDDPSAGDDRPQINVTINVLKKTPTDLNEEIERDKRYLDIIKQEIQKCKGPKKKVTPTVGQVNKELVLDKALDPEQLKKAMPKPLVEGVEIKEEIDIDKVKSEDDDVIDVNVIKEGKAMSRNPKFVIVIKKILKEMRFHTSRVDADKKPKFFGILCKILRMRIKELLEGLGYMKWRGVFELYRQHYDTEQDGELVASVFNAMLDGAYADFVPSDDEDYDSGREDDHLFLPYVTGKNKKNKRMDNENNVPNKKDEEVVIVAVTNAAEVIAISDSEDDDCTIVKSPDDALDVYAVIANAHVECKKEPKSEESGNDSKLSKTSETLDMKCKEEKDLSHPGGVVDNLVCGRVKVELPATEDIIDLDDDIDIVKTEIDEVDVKSEASTVELNDIATYGDELINSVKPESNTDCHETKTTTDKESGDCIQSIVIKTEPSREDLVSEILKLTETKLTETFTKDCDKGSTDSMQTMKEISKGPIIREVRSVIVSENMTDRTKDSSQANDTLGRNTDVSSENTIERKPNCVCNSSAERDDLVLQSDGNVMSTNEQNPKQVVPNITVKTEPEESVETIGNFVKQATTVVDESNLDTDDNVKQDAKATNHELQNPKQGVPNIAVKREPEEESVETIGTYLNFVTNVNVID